MPAKYSGYTADIVHFPGQNESCRMQKPVKILSPVSRRKMRLHQRNISVKNCLRICLAWNCCRRSEIKNEGHFCTSVRTGAALSNPQPSFLAEDEGFDLHFLSLTERKLRCCRRRDRRQETVHRTDTGFVKDVSRFLKCRGGHWPPALHCRFSSVVSKCALERDSYF